jgi:hypothetical protein
MQAGLRKNTTPPIILNNYGQSTIEYLIVTFTLITALISAPGIYEDLSSTMNNKYNSYSFAVAISDPPRKSFDDSIKKDAGKVKNILNLFSEIEDLVSDSIFPDLKKLQLPAKKDIEKFGKLIKKYL